MSDQDPHDDPTNVDTPVSDPTQPMPAAAGAAAVTEPGTPGDLPPTEPPGTDEPPPPDRRPWVIIGLLIVILLVALALLLNNRDDEDSADGSTTTSSTTSSSSTTTSSTTSTTAPTTTSTAEAPPTTVDPARCVTSAPDDPDTTAEVVFDSYTVDDRACASNLMTASALEQLFDIPGSGGGWEFMGCENVEDPEPQTLCSYRFEGGSTTFRMNYSDTEGWTVFEVFQTAD